MSALFPKIVSMTPLQMQVAELGCCPFCHTKRLKYVGTAAETDWHQCRGCLKVFVLPEVPKLIA